MIETARLVLRPWTEADKPAFHDIINTPAMMAHFGGVVPRAQIDALIDAQMICQARDGHCMWAVDTREGELAGICGMRVGGYSDTPVPHVLEIGWRIGERWWGQGIAREAAEASLAWGWTHTDWDMVAAWTNEGNTQSWGLMERLGMARRPELDFQHPKYTDADPLGAMIVYTIPKPAP